MSGGSYDYLYLRAPGDSYGRITAQTMVNRLRELGYPDAADEVEQIYLSLPSDALCRLMQAVEWCDSADTLEEDVHEAASANGYLRRRLKGGER